MCFIVLAFALAKLSSVFINLALIYFGIAALGFVFFLFLDIKNQRRERAAGKEVIWYQRPGLLNSGGLLCTTITGTITILIINNTLPRTPFFFILIVFFPLCTLCLACYGLKFALKQHKVAREQLKVMRDRQKDKRLE